MTDGEPQDLFRCDYCGVLSAPHKALIFWEQIDRTSDGDLVWLPAVYCSPYCGRTATTRAGTGRG